MGIERRCDAPHQKFRAVADRKPVVDHGHGAVCDQALDPRPVDDRGLMVPTVQPGYPGQIDRKVAHDPLDDIGAEAILPGECVSLGGGEPVFGDPREIVARRNGVLHEPLRHAADGAGAKADERIGGIVGVALEVALQPAVLSRDGQTVAWKGEMIEADADVACVQQGFGDGFGLQMPLVLPGRESSAILRWCLLIEGTWA